MLAAKGRQPSLPVRLLLIMRKMVVVLTVLFVFAVGALLVYELHAYRTGAARVIQWSTVCKEHRYRYHWEEQEMAHAAEHNEYYDHAEMFRMVQGWPLVVQAVEELSKPFVRQAKHGWYEVSPDISSVGLSIKEQWELEHAGDEEAEENPRVAFLKAKPKYKAVDDVRGTSVRAKTLEQHPERLVESGGGHERRSIDEVNRLLTHSVVDESFSSRTSVVQGSHLLSLYWNDCWSDKLPSRSSGKMSEWEKEMERRRPGFGDIDDLFDARPPKVVPGSPNEPHYFRMTADPFCNFLWMLKLRQEPVRSVDDVLAVVTYDDAKFIKKKGSSTSKEGFKPQQNGGMKAELSDINAYFKPCTLRAGNGESFLSEIMAFQIDRIFQFNRVPATVPRTMSASDLKALAVRAVHTDTDHMAVSKMQSILRSCGYGNAEGAEGSFVGWSNFPVTLPRHNDRPRVAPRLADLDKEEIEELAKGKMNINRKSAPEDIAWALELVTGHMFGALIGTLTRFRHNQHFFKNPVTMELGPSILLDNDRSQWNGPSRDMKKGNPIQQFCVFPEKLSKRIMMMDKTHIRVGDILLQIARIYAKSLEEAGEGGTASNNGAPEGELLWNNNMTKQLQKNIHFLASSIRACIKEHGEEAVLIPEVWDGSIQENFQFPGYASFYDVLIGIMESL